MRREVVEAFEEGELAPLMKVLMVRALQGDMAAARLLLEYTVGKPGKAVDPDTLDVEDIAIRRRHAITSSSRTPTLRVSPARPPCSLTDSSSHPRPTRCVASRRVGTAFRARPISSPLDPFFLRYRRLSCQGTPKRSATQA